MYGGRWKLDLFLTYFYSPDSPEAGVLDVHTDFKLEYFFHPLVIDPEIVVLVVERLHPLFNSHFKLLAYNNIQLFFTQTTSKSGLLYLVIMFLKLNSGLNNYFLKGFLLLISA